MKKKELIQLLLNEGTIERHQSGWYKTVTRDDIISAVNLMLLTDDFTTTLDVKNFLRERGYWVVQQDVSEVMDMLYSSGILKYLDNGTYRNYYFA